jgi:hypothetical protein
MSGRRNSEKRFEKSLRRATNEATVNDRDPDVEVFVHEVAQSWDALAEMAIEWEPTTQKHVQSIVLDAKGNINVDSFLALKRQMKEQKPRQGFD